MRSLAIQEYRETAHIHWKMHRVLVGDRVGIEDDRYAPGYHTIENAFSCWAVAWRLQAEDGFEKGMCETLWVFLAVNDVAPEKSAPGRVQALLHELVS
jgi:hypothetical protein